MKRYIALLLFSLGALFTNSFADNGFKYLKPATYDQVTKLTVAGKSRTYFVLEGTNQIGAVIEGPSQLKVMSRATLEKSDQRPDYSIEVLLEEGKKPRTIHHTSKLSEKADLPDGSTGYLGVLRSKVIDIPSGKHNVILRLPDGSKDKVYVRLSQKTNEFTGGTSVVAMTPFEYTTAVDLVSNETAYTYYRVGGEDRVALKLVGPATLKVLSRIEFGPEMKGNQRWKIQLMEDGNAKKTYSLAANNSDVIQYRQPSQYVPSRAETFFVEIPSGEHVYEFRLPDDRRTTLLRFLLPTSELTGDGSE
ncbi:MAG: hypothetical protein H6506_01380 [Calditrichaeota bacterium]|nr:hypothetical protein [Calditrichota bacterium]MCB9366459.1 hypothetical protein [Calditrichota bacterium]MCB9391283.1 hypothetical protein [Calditrichota bacterium]